MGFWAEWTADEALMADILFPTVTMPRPSGFDSMSPDNQNYIIELERRGLREERCSDCKSKSGRLYRCSKHRRWGR